MLEMTLYATMLPIVMAAVLHAHVLWAPGQDTTLRPGEYLEVQLPGDCGDIDNIYALEPRANSV